MHIIPLGTVNTTEGFGYFVNCIAIYRIPFVLLFRLYLCHLLRLLFIRHFILLSSSSSLSSFSYSLSSSSLSSDFTHIHLVDSLLLRSPRFLLSLLLIVVLYVPISGHTFSYFPHFSSSYTITPFPLSPYSPSLRPRFPPLHIPICNCFPLGRREWN